MISRILQFLYNKNQLLFNSYIFILLIYLYYFHECAAVLLWTNLIAKGKLRNLPLKIIPLNKVKNKIRNLSIKKKFSA